MSVVELSVNIGRVLTLIREDSHRMRVHKVRRVGNSNLIALPRYLEDAGYLAGARILIKPQGDGSIVLVPVNHVRIEPLASPRPRPNTVTAVMMLETLPPGASTSDLSSPAAGMPDLNQATAGASDLSGATARGADSHHPGATAGSADSHHHRGATAGSAHTHHHPAPAPAPGDATGAGGTTAAIGTADAGTGASPSTPQEPTEVTRMVRDIVRRNRMRVKRAAFRSAADYIGLIGPVVEGTATTESTIDFLVRLRPVQHAIGGATTMSERCEVLRKALEEVVGRPVTVVDDRSLRGAARRRLRESSLPL